MRLIFTVKYNIILVFALVVSHMTVFSQVSIIGEAPEYKNKQVLLYAEADPLSRKEVLLAETHTDEAGNFQLQATINQTQPLRLMIDRISGYLVALPDETYQTFFPPMADDQVKSFSGATTIELIFTDPAPNDINRLLSDINFAIDSMLIENISRVGSRHFLPALTAFQQQLEERFSTKNSHPYLAQHLKYTLALTEFSTRSHTRYDLYKKHLQTGDLEMHPTFFAFLQSYFQQYFQRYESNYGTNQILPALQSESPGTELLELMKKDDLLKNDTLRQLVAIHALMETYHAGVPKRKAADALDYIAQNGTTDFIRLSAANTKDLLTKTTPGFEAPNLQFLNQYNELVSLSDLRGKYVYLEFISTWCSDCKREQVILPDLLAEYADVTEVLTVIVGSSREEYNRYISANPQYSWSILFDGTGYKSIDNYRVRSLPTYFLIDPKGQLVLSPAPTPTDGIVEHLYPVLQKARDARRIQVGE